MRLIPGAVGFRLLSGGIILPFILLPAARLMRSSTSSRPRFIYLTSLVRAPRLLLTEAYERERNCWSYSKFHLHHAQNRQKQAADARRSTREFQVGDHVYLKLQPYRQQSLKNRNIPHKLSPRFYGPFLVTDRVGSVAYKLQLPATAAIHNVFHVSQLKLCPNPSSSASDLPQFLLDVGTAKEPEAILERKMVNRQNEAATKVLVHWKGETPDMATWEFYADFIAKYPAFHP
ncbi:hypothetical protein V2J09_000286 [Rumex salicifolius]